VNLTALRAHVRSLTGIQSTDILSDADLTIFINEAYQEINRDADWPFNRAETTLTVTSGTAEYNLPAGVGETMIASIAALADDTNRRQLRPRNRYTTDDSPGPVSTGYPYEYSAWGTKIMFFPTPNQSEVLTIRYFSAVADLSSGTDLPIFDAKFHTVIAYGAAVKVLVREGDDTERRSYYQGQYLQGVDQMKGDYLAERDRSIFRVGGRRRVFGRRANRYGV